MSKIKFALVAACTLAMVLCLGLFSGGATSWAGPAAPQVTKAAKADAAALPATEATKAKSSADESCKSSAELDDAAQALIPANGICNPPFIWTVCKCGNAGCRNPHVSPANFCGC